MHIVSDCSVPGDLLVVQRLMTLQILHSGVAQKSLLIDCLAFIEEVNEAHGDSSLKPPGTLEHGEAIPQSAYPKCSALPTGD